MTLPAFAATVWLAIAAAAGSTLEASLISHVLVEIPALIIIGIVLGKAIPKYIGDAIANMDRHGIAGILLASFALAFWMIPRWLDAAVTNEFIGFIKYCSLPLFVGIPIALSWQRLPVIARALVKIEILTMLLRLGWIYLESPTRLCNNYLLAEQAHLGYAFFALASVLTCYWIVRVFVGSLAVPSDQFPN